MATGLNMLKQVMKILDSYELSPEDEAFDNEETVKVGEGTYWNECIRIIRKDVQRLIDLEERDATQ